MKRILPMWSSYLAQVVPDDAGSTQIDETMRAFFGGAIAMHGLLTKIGEADEAIAMVIIEEIEKEIIEFIAQAAREAEACKHDKP